MADAQPQRVQDRLAFLLALVPYLLDNDGVSVGQANVGIDTTNRNLNRASGMIGETNKKIGVIDQAIQKIPIWRCHVRATVVTTGIRIDGSG